MFWPLQASGFQLGLKHGLAPGLLYLMPCQHVLEAVLTAQGLPECRDPGAQPFPPDRLGDGRHCAGTSTEQVSCAGFRSAWLQQVRTKSGCSSAKDLRQSTQCLQLCWGTVICLIMP